MLRIKTLEGEKCYLSPIIQDDLYQYTNWFNDLNITKYLASPLTVVNFHNEAKFLEHIIQNALPIFSIIDSSLDKLIGNCGLQDIDYIHRIAKFGIMIGDSNYWNKGIGSEATKLLLDYAFNYLNLHNIDLKVFVNNKRAIACYKKIGFKEIGIRKEGWFMAGRYFDMLLMDITSNDFVSNNNSKVKKIIDN